MTPDWNAIAVAMITAAQASLITVVVWGTKKALAKMPRAMLPLLATVLGVSLDAFVAWISNGHFSPIYGALTGCAATWLREAMHTVREHGTDA